MHESGSWQETKWSPDGSNEETFKNGLLAEEKAEFSKQTGTEEEKRGMQRLRFIGGLNVDGTRVGMVS